TTHTDLLMIASIPVSLPSARVSIAHRLRKRRWRGDRSRRVAHGLRPPSVVGGRPFPCLVRFEGIDERAVDLAACLEDLTQHPRQCGLYSSSKRESALTRERAGTVDPGRTGPGSAAARA